MFSIQEIIIKDSKFYLIYPVKNYQSKYKIPSQNMVARAIFLDKVELYLDNNAYINTNWIDDLKKYHPKIQLNFNLLPALIEQFLSNPEFVVDSHSKLHQKLSKLKMKGFNINTDRDYLENILDNARQQKELLSVKYYYVTTMLHIIILNKIIMSKNNELKKWEDKLEELYKDENIFKFNQLFLLSGLIIVAKKFQTMQINGDNKTIYSYLQNFFNFHTSGKNEENYIDLNYLRNRASDLFFWYSLTKLSKIGKTPVIVTGDKILYKILFPIIPMLQESNNEWAFFYNYEPLSNNQNFVNELKKFV